MCTEICFAGACFTEQAPSCVLVGVLTLERVSGACFRSKLLRVYWLEYLPGSVFQERVSGVCTGLNTWFNTYSSTAGLQTAVAL